VRKRSNAKPKVPPLQALIDREANEEANAPLVSPFARQHGDYDENARWGTRSKVTFNRGGSAIDRWKRDEYLSVSQQAAILHMQGLWRLIDQGQRLIVNLDRTVFGCNGDGNHREIEARHDVHRIKNCFPHEYWDIFERVCRWDEPAGTAGSRLANFNRTASESARLVVCMVADMIAMNERLSFAY
jgi:hypothetical protein